MTDYEYEINGKNYKVVLRDLSGDNARVEVNGVEYHVKMKSNSAAPASNPGPAKVVAAAAAPEAIPAARKEPLPAPQSGGGGLTITAPISGVILKVNVQPGDMVKAGDVVAIIEAMKMENNISATRDGKVKEVKVQAGSEVPEGEVLIVLAES
jgi:biotin carboxyl carrier protein